MTLLAPPHAHGPAYGENLRVVGHEEAVLEHGTTAAPIVQLEVTGNYALVLPALEDVAAFVTESELAGAQRTEVLRHLRSDVVTHLNQNTSGRTAIDFNVEEVNWIHVNARILNDGGDGRLRVGDTRRGRRNEIVVVIVGGM